MKILCDFRVLPEGQNSALSGRVAGGVGNGSVGDHFIMYGSSQLALPPAPPSRCGTPAWFAAEIAKTDHEQQAYFDSINAELNHLQNDLNFLIGVEVYGENKIALNTARDVRMGQVLNQMKRTVKKLYLKWTGWADKNIDLKKRTREIVMRVAAYNFDQKWYKLGKSKLDRVCAALDPLFCPGDDVNLIMEYLVRRCDGHGVFHDPDPRLENEIVGLYSACRVLKELEGKIQNNWLLIAAANSGLEPTKSTLDSLKSMNQVQIESELERYVETGRPGAVACVVTKNSTRCFDEIFEQINQYYLLFINSKTTDKFDKAKAIKAIKVLQEMVSR